MFFFKYPQNILRRTIFWAINKLNKFKGIENMFSDNNEMKVEINNRKMMGNCWEIEQYISK